MASATARARVLELKSYIDSHAEPARALEELHRFADVGELVILSAFTEPSLIEPVALLLGGGLERMDQGMEGMGKLWEMFIEEYIARCERAGFMRRERCRIPMRAPWLH